MLSCSENYIIIIIIIIIMMEPKDSYHSRYSILSKLTSNRK
jgi:hypothetical protein